MVEKIRQLLHMEPFMPFKIRTTDGREYFVATADHAVVRPLGSRVIVFGDDEQDIYLSGLRIVAVEEQAPSSRWTTSSPRPQPSSPHRPGRPPR